MRILSCVGQILPYYQKSWMGQSDKFDGNVRCTFDSIVEHRGRVSSSTPLSTQPVASMVHQRTLETIEEEEVKIEAIFDDETAGDEDLCDPTTATNAENQDYITAPLALQPTTSRVWGDTIQKQDSPIPILHFWQEAEEKLSSTILQEYGRRCHQDS